MYKGQSNEFKIDNIDEFKKLVKDYIKVKINKETNTIQCFMKEEGIEELDCMWIISNIILGEDVYMYAEGDEIESISEYVEYVAKKNEDFFSETNLTNYIQKHLLEGEVCIFTFNDYNLDDTALIWTITKDEVTRG